MRISAVGSRSQELGARPRSDVVAASRPRANRALTSSSAEKRLRYELPAVPCPVLASCPQVTVSCLSLAAIACAGVATDDA